MKNEIDFILDKISNYNNKYDANDRINSDLRNSLSNIKNKDKKDFLEELIKEVSVKYKNSEDFLNTIVYRIEVEMEKL